MNILFSFLSAKYNAFGGVERSLFTFRKGLENHGCKVFFYTSNVGSTDANILQSSHLLNEYNYPPEQIDQSILDSYAANKSKIRKEITQIVLNNQINYVLVVDQLWGIIPHIHLNLKKLPCRTGIIFHMYYQKELINMTFAQGYDDYFAVSNDVRNAIEKNCILHNQKITILPNTYNREVFYYAPRSAPYDYIFCNSRLAVNKGIEYLLTAFKSFNALYPSCKLVLCGGTYYFGDRSYIISIIHRFLNENPNLTDSIIIKRNLQWDEIPDFIRNSCMVVLPSGYESFGIAALEAIACEVPLVTTTAGNLPELVDSAGITVDYGSSKQLFEAMKNIMEDQNKRELLRKDCQNVKHRYEADSVAESFLNHISSSQPYLPEKKHLT